MNALPAVRRDDHFTYGDYCTWPGDERWELIDGVPYAMAPAPSRFHQGAVVELTRQIANQLLNRPCQVFAAPFDVRLPKASEADKTIDTVVQPDIVVVCDERKLDRQGCRGAPDWIIEVLSPATAQYDQITKLRLYERHGVAEVWLVHPTDRVVTVYRLGSDKTYGRPLVMALEGALSPADFPDLVIEWAWVAKRLEPLESSEWE
ncbi:Uma2 family endonuclease [Gammaproteobacteria bacterium]